jgi:cysteine sulfinate desulfinase/cysteine desulfurase-like protein
LAPALCVGFGEACRIAKEDMKNNLQHLRKLQCRMINFFVDKVKGVRFNGSL